MILLERIVLLLLENGPHNRMREQHLHQVCNVLNKRYGLQMERSLEKFDLVLTRMLHTYIDQTPRGFCLNDGGRMELVPLHEQQSPFCESISRTCQIMLRGIITRVSARVLA